MALPNLTGQNIQDTYQRLLQKSGSGDITDGTGSLFIPPTASFAISASYAVSASHEIIKEISSSHADIADGLTGQPSIHVTNITASGTVQAEHLYSTDDAVINDDLTVGGNISSSGNFEINTRQYTVESDYNGDIITYGSGPGGVNGDIVKGEVYCLDNSQQWEKVDANALATSVGLLGIAVANDVPTFLLKGSAAMGGVFTGLVAGAPLYISETPGDVTTTAPTTAGAFVRILGYSLDGVGRTIWFDPDKTWVELSS